MEWINVNDKFPPLDEQKDYLVIHGGICDIAFWSAWEYSGEWDRMYITHWMPLPELPE